MQQPLLNEKVLRDKRKKLRETFERIVHLYERENPDTYKDLRKLELDYETKRGQLSLYFDSVKVRRAPGVTDFDMGRHLAQEVERVGGSPGRVLVRSPLPLDECRGVPEQGTSP